MTPRFGIKVVPLTQFSPNIEVDSKTYVFGGTDGGWFKMRSVDANGSLMENRHTKAVRTIGDLTVAIWKAANKGEERTVEGQLLCIMLSFMIRYVIRHGPCEN